MDIGFSTGRMIGTAVATVMLTAVAHLGGVWLIVGLTMGGLTTAVETTNTRIGDLGDIVNTRITDVAGSVTEVDRKIFALQGIIANGFRDTRNDIQKASRFDPLQIPPEAIRLARKIEERARVDAMMNPEPRVVFLPSDEAWGKYIVSDGSSLASAALDEAEKVRKIVDNYTVQGMSLEELVKRAKAKPSGYGFKSQGGVDFVLISGDNSLTLRSASGKVATVEGMGQEETNLSILRLDSTFDIRRF